MICTNCQRNCISNKTIIRYGKIYSGCEQCINSIVQGNETAAQYSRERMKRDYAKDLVQPIHPREFIQAYGTEKSQEFYNKETIRKFS